MMESSLKDTMTSAMAGSTSMQPLKAVTSVGEVPRALDQMEYEIVELEAEIARLTDKLLPVLGLPPQDDAGQMVSPEVVYGSVLGNTLDSYRGRVVVARRRLATLVEQVQL